MKNIITRRYISVKLVFLLKTMKELIKKIYGILFFSIFRIFPLQDKIVFSTFSGKKYADNSKYISVKCHELYPNIKQIWLQHKGYKIDVPAYITIAQWPSINMIYHLATAKVWVDSHTKPVWVEKRKKQLYINTWHGGLGIKKIEGDSKEKLTKNEIRRSKHNSNMVDIFISNSTWITDIYKRAFWYNGEILECGYPKNDILFKREKHNEIKEKVRKYYNVKKEKKILLYAPTFRNDEKFKYDIELKKIYETLNKTEEEWIIMYKLHPILINSKTNLLEIKDEIIDATGYNDMQEMIIASDILITDYSSCIFDEAMLYKPAFIYAPDVEDYIKDRGLYFDIKKLPFPFSGTNEKLIENIENFDEEKYKKDLDDYFKKVGLKESGTASLKVAEIIEEYVKKTN